MEGTPCLGVTVRSVGVRLRKSTVRNELPLLYDNNANLICVLPCPITSNAIAKQSHDAWCACLPAKLIAPWNIYRRIFRKEKANENM